MKNIVVVALLTLAFWVPATLADDSIGIFETVLESSVSFSETNAALEPAIRASGLTLHASHVVRVPDDKHQARIYVLTAPSYVEAAAAESPRTISAQILRIAVFTSGEEQKTLVNMANPVAHAMVYYADSSNYDALIAAANDAAEKIRQLVKAVPGEAVSRQTEPMRSEKHYRKFKGDGPARMMAKFRTWKKSQLPIKMGTAVTFPAMVDHVASALESGTIADASEAEGWEVIARIQLRDDAVYFGLTNPFIEDKMIRINSRFRNDAKSDKSPFPGVDHMAALPTEVLVVDDGFETLVLHYGQMWRMQLYFWDSGYRAFTANVGVPGDIVNSIESAVQAK
ncbi:MAG: hypothetical protein OEU90_08630 [Gammaproteobacteria bacterium]|nr:hypothetical protein [Gammaproteobacteria bacterium]MDH3805521.1 hypothetical protein [Gammaproteobacteria bacterium]